MPAMHRSPDKPVRPTLRQRLEFQFARMMFALPTSVQHWLSARRPVVVQGATLHPQMQLMLTLHAALRPMPPTAERVVAEARAAMRRDTLTVAGRPIALGGVTDFAIAGDGGMIGARHYAPLADGPRPLLVYLHGGGFVTGDLDTHDTICRRLCRDADIHVLAVDYRLAPEHPFPAAVEDAVTAFRWAHANAATLGTLPDKVAVGGDSAGGNLAAVVCQQTAAVGGPTPCAQFLLYPPIDRTRTWPSMEVLADGYFLTRADIDWSHVQYTGSSTPRPDPAMNPLCAKDFTGLAPALIITAGFDPLRDEGEAYAKALAQAGVPVVLKRFDGLLHGFASMTTFSPVCDTAVGEITAALHDLISSPATAGRA